ncbi:MAG: hypothetical protein ACLFTT_18110 [Candidatus Hydrogenedentota bacterium]
MLSKSILVVMFVLYGSMAAAQTEEAPAPSLAFTATIVDGAFTFDTGVLRGHLRHGGGSIGLVPMHHVPTETPLANIPGILNYYRVFSTNHRYVESMRGLPSSAEKVGTNAVRAHWDAGEEHPYTLDATYVLTQKDTLDLVTEVTAQADLPDFEIFLSSYCGEAFKTTHVFVQKEEGMADFMAADKIDKVWQMFPRDDAAVKLIQDGRWTYPSSPVDWAIRPAYAAPLLYRKDEASGVAIVLMTRPEDCFAVSTPETGEQHYSMYFSLFGTDVKKGETVRAFTRLVVGEFDNEDVVGLYNEFLEDLKEESTQ